MAKLVLLWTKTVLKQRNHILKYWNKRNKSTMYSRRLLLVINENKADSFISRNGKN